MPRRLSGPRHRSARNLSPIRLLFRKRGLHLSDSFQVTPVLVDCADCFVQALGQSGIDWRQPSSIFTNLRNLPAKTRHALIDSLIDHAEGEAFLIVTAGHLVRRDDQTDTDTDATDVDPEAMLDDEQFDAISH